MIGRIIRIVAASTVSLLVAFIFMKVGVMLQVPQLDKIGWIPLAITSAYIIYADIKIWNEKEQTIVSLG